MRTLVAKTIDPDMTVENTHNLFKKLAHVRMTSQAINISITCIFCFVSNVTIFCIQITRVKFVHNKVTDIPSFALLEFAEREDARKVLAKYNGVVLPLTRKKNISLQLSWAQPDQLNDESGNQLTLYFTKNYVMWNYIV